MRLEYRKWIARVLIGIVVFFNLDAAFSFLIKPGLYAPGFELAGIPGEKIIQGIGLLFLMWNVPYLIALLDPGKHFPSLIEALIMQGIGVIGESILLSTLIGTHPAIRSSTVRFIFFDGGGLILLLVAMWIVWGTRKILLVK
jgi:hypothetical protein